MVHLVRALVDGGLLDGQALALLLEALLLLDAPFFLELALALFLLEAQLLGQGFLPDAFLLGEAYSNNVWGN